MLTISPALPILGVYGLSLLALALALGRASHFSWEAVPFALLTVGTTLFCTLRFSKGRPLGERLIFSGSSLLLILLVFGDLFIYLAAPLALAYLIIRRREILALLRPQSPLAYGWLALIACGVLSGFGAQSPISAWAMSAALAGFGLIFIVGRDFFLPKGQCLFLSDLFTGLLPLTLCFVFFHLSLNRPISLLGISFAADRSAFSFVSDWAANGAGFLVLSFAFIFVRLLRQVKEGLPFWGTALSLTVVFSGALATQTRMVFFFFAGFGLIFLTFYPWKLLRRTRFLFAALPLGLIPLLVQFSEKWRETLANPWAQASFIDRFLQVKLGWELFQSRPLTGIGLFNFRFYYAPLAEAKNLPPVEFLHNIYMSMGAETGTLGLGIFLGVTALLIYTYGRHRGELLPYGGLLLLCGVLLHNLTDNWLYVLKFSLLLFFALGAFYPKTPSKR